MWYRSHIRKIPLRQLIFLSLDGKVHVEKGKSGSVFLAEAGEGVMIVFDLCCANGHRFEGWFDSHEDFEEQKQQGQIACPCCNDVGVEKLPSPVTIKKASPRPSAREAWFKLQRYLLDNFEDVGHNFAKEALKIHWGVEEKRNIRGVTTDADEKVLEEEGVQFLKIPAFHYPDT